MCESDPECLILLPRCRQALGFQGYTALLGLCGAGTQDFMHATQALQQVTSRKFTFAKAFGKSLEVCTTYQLLFLSVEEGQPSGPYLRSIFPLPPSIFLLANPKPVVVVGVKKGDRKHIYLSNKQRTATKEIKIINKEILKVPH